MAEKNRRIAYARMETRKRKNRAEEIKETGKNAYTEGAKDVKKSHEKVSRDEE